MSPVPAPALRSTSPHVLSDDRLSQLYRRYGGAVYARCRRLLRDEDAAQDAAQEVFCRIQRHLARVPEAADALPWIFRVTSNYCFNQLRDGRRRRQLPKLIDLGQVGQSGSTDLALQTHARWLMQRLPEKLRKVAWLHHVEGRDQQEVADLVGVSRRTVLYRLADLQQTAIALGESPPRPLRDRAP
jgi:RNA polymerase sigma-70 factor (ECF subfamily)